MDTVIAFYKFVPINNLVVLRKTLQDKLIELQIKGTILLADEGINGTISGKEESIRAFITYQSQDERFADIEYKFSYSDQQTYRRSLVKIKKEIITMGHKHINPREHTGAFLAPKELKKWLDAGKEFVFLDTRNNYEVEAGTFQNAINPNIKTFGQFPEWVEKNMGDKKNVPIVTFCTGGIRCEKASAYMMEKGFQEVYQIQGGILKYFEETTPEGGDKYWEGDCVVFDKRKAVTPTLAVTKNPLCYVCLMPIKENQEVVAYPYGDACLDCHSSMQQNKEARMKDAKERQLAFRAQRREHCAKMRANWETP